MGGALEGSPRTSSRLSAKARTQSTPRTKEYGDELAKLRLNIEKGNKTEQEWSDALRQAFVEVAL
jgi:hypothetical protein